MSNTAKYETLRDLFSDIAVSIRAKTNSNEKIIAENFPEAIDAIDVDVSLEEITVEHEIINTQNLEYQVIEPGEGFDGISKVSVPKVRLVSIGSPNIIATELGYKVDISTPEGFDGMSRVVQNIQFKPVLAGITITPSTEVQTFTPTDGVVGFGEVIVEAVENVGTAVPTISVSNDGTVVATVNQQTGYVSGGETTASYMLSDVDNVESLRENIKAGSTVFGIEGTYSGNAVSAVTEEIETSMFGEGTNIYDRTITVSENIGQLCGFNLVFNADGTDIGMMSYDANNENCVQIVYVADSSYCAHETASASFSENTITIRLGSTWRTTSLWSNIYFEQGSVTYIPE